MNPKKSKPTLEITPIGGSKLPWLNNRESEAFLILTQKETCRVRRTTRHTFFLSHPEIRMDARTSNKGAPQENIPAAEMRLEGVGTLEDAVKMAEGILEPVLKIDARLLAANAPWAESTSLKDVEKPTPAQMKFLLIKNALNPEDIPFLTRREAGIRITAVHSLEAARLASQQMPVGIYKGVAFDMLHVYNPRYLKHTLTSGAAKGWGADDAIQTATEKNPLDWVKNHRRKLFAAHLAGQEAELRERWDAGDHNTVRNAIETALAADPENPWTPIQAEADLAKEEKKKLEREESIKAVESKSTQSQAPTTEPGREEPTPEPAKPTGRFKMISEQNAHLFKRPETKQKPLRMNARDFQTIIRENPAWANSLTHDLEIIGFCNMEGSPITHLSDKLIFRGDPKVQHGQIQFAEPNKAASFRNCRNLKVAEGVFDGYVTFEGSSIETIGNLTVTNDPGGFCASFRNCTELKAARGNFISPVDFSHSGIEKIERDLQIKNSAPGTMTTFEGCKNLKTAEGKMPGGACFDNTSISAIAYLNTADYGGWGPASFLGCKNLKRESIPVFFQNGRRYAFDPETVPRTETPAVATAAAVEPWPF